MRAAAIVWVITLSAAMLPAQTPAANPTSHASDLGYTYTPPKDWDVVNSNATLPAVKEQARQNATSDEEKKGVACVQVSLTARHGEPASVLVIVELPFACFGQSMSPKDLPGFAQGASEGVKQSFDVAEPSYGEYALGGHSMWIERAKATPKGHPEMPYTVEIACALLKKGAACWMAMAADDDSLKSFEQGQVALEDEAATVLVPASAFDKKPTP
ncbi:MAG TPA: hypothetical protein VHZ28_10085 [Terracidiphilus sp.]|jgi:hypothetical protein|nr:hypothetical protein [Terracidiphilus sp.]